MMQNMLKKKPLLHEHNSPGLHYDLTRRLKVLFRLLHGKQKQHLT